MILLHHSNNAPPFKRSKMSDSEDAEEVTTARLLLTEERRVSIKAAGLDFISFFEQLPRELIHQIIDYVPESISELRLTSRSLLSQIDEYAVQPATIQFVEELKFREDQHASINIFISVPKKMSRLFELRLRLISSGIEWGKLITRQEHIFDYDWNDYELHFNPQNGDVNLLKRLRQCIGRRVGKVILSHCKDSEVLLAVSKLLEGTHFEKLSVTIAPFSADISNHLLKTIKEHKVDNLSLCVSKNVSSNPVRTLLEITSIVKTFRITQMRSCHDNQDVMFGVLNIDWSTLILKMFSGNLDKLHIVHNSTGYFPLSSAKIVIEKLPSLGKNVWFEADCCASRKTESYTVNDHIVNSSPDSLRIKHTSRENEEAEY